MNLGSKDNYLPSEKAKKVSDERIAKVLRASSTKKQMNKSSTPTNTSNSINSFDGTHPVRSPDSTTITDFDKELPQRKPSTPTPAYRTANSHGHFIDVRDDEDSNATTTFHNRQWSLGNESPDSNMDFDLDYKPVLKDKYSPLPSRRYKSLNVGDISMKGEHSNNFTHPKQRIRPQKPSRKISIRKSLGDPLPLPYLQEEKPSAKEVNNVSHLSTRENSISKIKPLDEKEINRKRKELTSKWRKYLSANRMPDPLTSKVRVSLSSSEGTPDVSAKDTTNKNDERRRSVLLTPTIESHLPPNQTLDALPLPSAAYVTKLHEELKENSEKLDQIITLLAERELTPTSFYQSVKKPTNNIETKLKASKEVLYLSLIHI